MFVVIVIVNVVDVLFFVVFVFGMKWRLIPLVIGDVVLFYLI